MLVRIFCSLILCGALGISAHAQATKAPPTVETPKAVDYSPIVVAPAHAKAARDKALAALPKEVAAGFVKKPLVEVARLLSERSGVPVEIDEHELSNALIGTDLPITFRREKCRLREALDGATHDYKLNWVIRGPGILITSQEAFEKKAAYMDTVVYPVTDLMKESDHKYRSHFADDLVDFVTDTVQPKSWKDSGSGEASIWFTLLSDSLVIRQTRTAHEELEELLIALRKTRAKRIPDSRPFRPEGGF